MLDIIRARLLQGYRTHPFPKEPPTLPEDFRGLPRLEGGCPGTCRSCLDVCPTGALSKDDGGLVLDMGLCLFCGACARACAGGKIAFSRDYRLARRRREDLLVRPGPARPLFEPEGPSPFRHSLHLRQVSAGGCNACEADCNVLGTLTFDMERFGIFFSASPRHADGLLVTGPVTANMALALRKAYDALPRPRLVIAAGSCAVSGGLYADHDETLRGASSVLPVDCYIPGCPPSPWTLLDGLLRLMGGPVRNGAEG